MIDNILAEIAAKLKYFVSCAKATEIIYTNNDYLNASPDQQLSLQRYIIDDVVDIRCTIKHHLERKFASNNIPDAYFNSYNKNSKHDNIIDKICLTFKIKKTKEEVSLHLFDIPKTEFLVHIANKLVNKEYNQIKSKEYKEDDILSFNNNYTADPRYIISIDDCVDPEIIDPPCDHSIKLLNIIINNCTDINVVDVDSLVYKHYYSVRNSHVYHSIAFSDKNNINIDEVLHELFVGTDAELAAFIDLEDCGKKCVIFRIKDNYHFIYDIDGAIRYTLVSSDNMKKVFDDEALAYLYLKGVYNHA